jgi:hypothetical protein
MESNRKPNISDKNRSSFKKSSSLHVDKRSNKNINEPNPNINLLSKRTSFKKEGDTKSQGDGQEDITENASECINENTQGASRISNQLFEKLK